MKYFKVIDDLYEDQFIDEVLDHEGRSIHLPELIGVGPLSDKRFDELTFVRLAQATGSHPPASFSVSHAGVPVVNSEVAALLRVLAPDDVQLVPGTLKGTQERFYLVNLLKQIDCLDRERSVFSVYPATPGIPEHLVGQIRGIGTMRIDPSKVGAAQIFRAYAIHLIVSEAVWSALLAAGVEGVKAERVA
jgi:hypothetical protein